MKTLSQNNQCPCEDNNQESPENTASVTSRQTPSVNCIKLDIKKKLLVYIFIYIKSGIKTIRTPKHIYISET
jgi:hypothetical protein